MDLFYEGFVKVQIGLLDMQCLGLEKEIDFLQDILEEEGLEGRQSFEKMLTIAEESLEFAKKTQLKLLEFNVPTQLLELNRLVHVDECLNV